MAGGEPGGASAKSPLPRSDLFHISDLQEVVDARVTGSASVVEWAET